MSLGDVLNADLGEISQRLREGVVWWFDELGAMVTPVLSKTRREAKVTVERRDDGAYLVRRPDHPDRLHLPGDAAISAALVLPASAVLTRTLSAPPLPERDIRRMLTLDLDRLTPFAADAAYHDIRLAPAPGEEGKRQVRLAVTPRAEADLAVMDARAADVAPLAVIARGDDDEVFDFLPAMRAAGAATGRGHGSRYLWIAVCLLLALNLGLAIWRDTQGVARLQAAVTAQQPVMERIRLLRSETQERTAQTRAAARASGEPLRVLNALSEALPQDAWVQRLSWDGTSVRLVGLRHDGVDVIGALRRDPMLVNVRDADASSTSADGFDVVADVAPPGAAVSGR